MKVCGHEIDAAIDCDFCLHCYDAIREDIKPNTVAVELYCFDMPEWDIEVVYFVQKNDQQRGFDGILHTVVDYEEIRNAARRWVRSMMKSENK